MSPTLHPYLTVLFLFLVVARWRVANRVTGSRKWALWLWLDTFGGTISLLCMGFERWGINYWSYWLFLFAKHIVVAAMIVEMLGERMRIPRKFPESWSAMSCMVMVTLVGTPAAIFWFQCNPDTSQLLMLGNAVAVWMALPLWLTAVVCYLNYEQQIAVNGMVFLYSAELIAMALLQFIPATRPQAWALQMGSELVVLCWWWWKLRMEVS